MMKHFSLRYVGQIELEHVGIDGIPADERRYPNERLIGCFSMAQCLPSSAASRRATCRDQGAQPPAAERVRLHAACKSAFGMPIHPDRA